MTTHKKECEWCRKEFLSKRNDARFCSNSHRQLAYLDRTPVYYREPEPERTNPLQYGNENIKKQQQLNQILESFKVVMELTVKRREEFLKNSNDATSIIDFNEQQKQLSVKRIEDFELNSFKMRVEDLFTEVLRYNQRGKILKPSLKRIINDATDILQAKILKNHKFDPLTLQFIEITLLPFLKTGNFRQQKINNSTYTFELPSEISQEAEKYKSKLVIY